MPASDVPGERAAPTQPFALKPEPFARQLLTEDMLITRTPAARAAVLERFRQMRSAGLFVPLALDKQTVVFPGFDGGAEWGGQAVDPSGVIYINGTDVPYYSGLRPNKTSSVTRSASGFMWNNARYATASTDRAPPVPPPAPSG